uniref:Inositol-tetrakisphosphate 1-kinase N-terminal domain-containing protein n=1 Tax=Fagus sylvatica TaxID=28930 RepID=A0A2N9EPJ5_FAGSY
MRLNGEIEEEEVEVLEEKKLVVVAETYSIGVGFPQPPHKLVVGYALTSKKKNSFLQPKFLALARFLFAY